MALTNTESDLYARIRHLLEDDPAWSNAFAAGSRLWDNNAPSVPDDESLPAADGDYPRSHLALVSGSTDLFDGDQTFCTHADGFDPQNAHWTENGLYVFELVLVSQLIDLTEQGRLGALSRRALRAGGPRLDGLDFVTGLRLEWRITKTEEESETHEMRRFITRMTIRVTTQTDGNTLLGTE